MKKRLFISLASVTLVIGCSYFLTGKLIQQSYYDTVASINTNPKVKVSLISYDRGLFHSHANIKVTFNSTEIPLRQTITHGPLIVANTPNGFRLKILASQLKTTFADDWQQKLIQYTENNNPLTITTFVGFSKQANTWLKLTALDQTAQNKLRVTWNAMLGEIEHDLDFKTYHGSFKSPTLTISNEVWNFNVKDLAINVDSSTKDNIFSHSNTIETKNLSFSRNNNELIKMDDISAKLETNNVADGKITLSLLATIANSQIVQQKFAQDSFKLQINNINHLALYNKLPDYSNLSLQVLSTFGQELTAESTELNIELPKHFTEALLSYVSFELYRSSLVGQYDKREESVVLNDISKSITNLVQGALKERLFIDKGAVYTFNLPAATPPALIQETPATAEEPKHA